MMKVVVMAILISCGIRHMGRRPSWSLKLQRIIIVEMNYYSHALIVVHIRPPPLRASHGDCLHLDFQMLVVMT